MWFHAGGPDEARSGLALCVLHHELCDRGAFTRRDDGCIVHPERVTVSDGSQDTSLRHYGRRAFGYYRPVASTADKR